jgi:hypothetical protein
MAGAAPGAAPAAAAAAAKIPTDAELEAHGAVIGTVMVDNQNIFNLADPKENTRLFRLADRLHIRTRASVIRAHLLFRPGDLYKPRLLAESERLLRAEGYFYDAWIRPVRWHDNKVDVEVTTRDVWTLDPGFNFGRSGGTNATGVQLEDSNLLGLGTDVQLSHTTTIDRSSSQLEVSDDHAFGTWTGATANYADLSDGRLRELTVQQPFYALDTRWAAGVYGLNDLQSDSLWDRSNVIDRFEDLHHGAQVYGALSTGLEDGWVRRWNAGVTYDEHEFAPDPLVPAGPSLLPANRSYVYPWVQFDIIQDDFIKLYNHDQIGRAEDFYIGTAASVRVGATAGSLSSSGPTLLFQSTASRGFSLGGSLLLLYGDFSGRVSGGQLQNGLADAVVRYFVVHGSHWLFYASGALTRGWRLDLDDQILLGGDNGMRGYPLRYQDGTGRAQFTVEQRYFTDWYPLQLVRVGGAIFADAGRTWGQAPLGEPSLGVLKDAGFGLRLGNARSGLGNVIHIDLAFPFSADQSIRRVQFLVQTEQHF